MKLTTTEKDFLIYAVEQAKRNWEDDLYEAVTVTETDNSEIEWIQKKIERAEKLIRKVRWEDVN